MKYSSEDIKKAMLLYAVTDRGWLGNKRLEDEVEKICSAGATFIQLREKDITNEEFLTEARKIKKITDKYKVPFVINDNIEVAKACDADGVHIGQSDIEAKKAREILGEGKIIGISAGNIEEALAAQKNGADYIGVGAMFHTDTKQDATSVTYDDIRKICESVSIPVVAIGGINKDNVRKLSGSGIDGIAVVSAIFGEEDVAQATGNMVKLARETVKKTIKNIIFDLDGTLIDSMPVWNNVGREFLIKNEIEPPNNLEEIFKTMSFSESNEYFKREFGLKLSAGEMISSIVGMVSEKYEKEIPLKPFAYEFLLKEHKKGTRMCILTASEADYVVPALKRLNIDGFFEEIYTCTSLGMSKSKSDIYEAVAAKFVAAKGETAVFEDAVHAVENAKKAGFYVVAVEDLAAKNDMADIKKLADKYIVSYSEVL